MARSVFASGLFCALLSSSKPAPQPGGLLEEPQTLRSEI
ncbi:hypothetical protein HMPREF1249_0470 [Jonquetella sp. BV3C21]|nr:hypothetical protein HMPREF1249_0470 [Jonquetella sp. BV3C21]